MAGRFPFEAPGGGRAPPQLNSAQVRAALQLGGMDERLFMEAQRQQQRDYQIRQIILHEQLEQIQEQSLRAIRELQDYPDLQQQYLLNLNEQLERKQQQAAQAQAQIRYQEELRLQQQLGIQSSDIPVASPAANATTSPLFASLPSPEALGALQQQQQQQSQLERKRSYSRDDGEDVDPSGKRPAVESDLKPKKRASKLSSPVVGLLGEGVPPIRPEAALEAVAAAVHMVVPQIVRKGTLDNLLDAAADWDKVDDAADVLRELEGGVEWPDSDDEEVPEKSSGLQVPSEPAESFRLPSFKSELPRLPEEPVFEETAVAENGFAPSENGAKAAGYGTLTPEKEDGDLKPAAITIEPTKKLVSAVLEYPYPVDTWWPSLTGMRRERRNAGETSDEDNFQDSQVSAVEPPIFRANERKIRSRLAKEVEPGVLEKLPHCRIHRVRTKRKKNSTAPELVYCWQVTEIYPNDIMVVCSKCGAWRHASCGGHHTPYSTKEAITKPFIPVCEFCREEEKFLKDHPQAEKRIERQRMEQLRRGLSTSAVMRHASFSKHGGTYKWPLGSVSGTHIGGHTRSVHARHDKSEKQWTDMATRLGRGYGYRPKERVRSRTKELERLLVSVEDAEGYTDRHNMVLFLTRDIAREKPVGFERELKNIFDPADDETPHLIESDETSGAVASPAAEPMVIEEGSENGQENAPTICQRQSCSGTCRFDSLFCSDACGVASLEEDLLRTLQDASDIHPSVLRL